VFNEISNLIGVLSRSGVLKDPDVIDALSNFSRAMGDTEYRSHMLGELSVNLALNGDYDRAEQLARMVESTDKCEFLRRIAELEKRSNDDARASRLFSEAVAAVSLHRFPTQQALALAEIARSPGEGASYAEADLVWQSAIQLATKAQRAPGTDGPEAAGVLVKAVQALSKLGKIEMAESVANSIAFPELRERARRALNEAGRS
jgi:hypothetical protein